VQLINVIGIINWVASLFNPLILILIPDILRSKISGICDRIYNIPFSNIEDHKKKGVMKKRKNGKALSVCNQEKEG